MLETETTPDLGGGLRQGRLPTEIVLERDGRFRRVDGLEVVVGGVEVEVRGGHQAAVRRRGLPEENDHHAQNVSRTVVV